MLFLLVGVLTLMPLDVLPTVAGSDKTHHVIAFAALALPCALLHPRSLIWMVPGMLIFGAAIEWTQPYVGRQGELADFIADCIGVVKAYPLRSGGT